MRLHCALIILACTLFSAAASADDYDGSSAAIATDLADVQACMTKADGAGDAARGCLRLASDACLARIAGKASHAAQSECFYRESRIFHQLYQDRVMIGLSWARWNDADDVTCCAPSTTGFRHLWQPKRLGKPMPRWSARWKCSNGRTGMREWWRFPHVIRGSMLNASRCWTVWRSSKAGYAASSASILICRSGLSPPCDPS